MTYILTELLDPKPSAIYTLNIPLDADGFSPLKAILGKARWLLSKKSGKTIEQACNDLFSLYKWFYEQQENQLNHELDEILSQADNTLSQYVDRKHYLKMRMKGNKADYPGHFDILRSILTRPNTVDHLHEINVVKTRFSNAEYFAVLALYKGSSALMSLREYTHKNSQEHVNDGIPNILPLTLSSAIKYLVEAQIAIDYAEQLTVLQKAPLSKMAKGWRRIVRQKLSQDALAAKFGDKFRLRKQKAIELYQQGNFHSRRQAALKLAEPIQQFSEANDIKLLKQGNEVDTIYRWLSEYDKQHPS